MQIKFLGVGSAFTTQEYFQSNLQITAESGKKLLIDCGTDVRFSMMENSISNEEIDAIYISHLHSDHIGGMEWMAFTTYFNPKKDRPRLFMEKELIKEIWESSLKGGLGSIEGKRMHLTDFFRCTGIPNEGTFEWERIQFTIIRMRHIMNGYKNLYSYGLIFRDLKTRSPWIFLTTDTQFQPGLINRMADQAALIFHDCETSPFKSTVHAHYDELKTLPLSVKRKMWLYHYQPNPVHQPEMDGFKGFVKKGQIFEL